MFSSFASMSDIHISVAAQKVFEIAGFPVTNAIITGAIGVIILFAILGYVVHMVKNGKYNRFVGLVQWCFEGMFGQVLEFIPNRKIARQIAPFALAIFFVMLASYWMSIMPGLDTIKYNDVSILRAMTADLNFPIAVSIVVLILVQYFAIKSLGPIGNLKRYLKNPIKDPIGSFEGLLEIIGEVSRYSALAVRMFGNCFAGELLLVLIAVLTSYASAVVLPVFMLFELFIGFVQAYVFFVLTVIFTSLAIEIHDTHPKSDHSPADVNNATQQE